MIYFDNINEFEKVEMKQPPFTVDCALYHSKPDEFSYQIGGHASRPA